MDKNGFSQNKMSKIIKTTRWHGSTNFIWKCQIVNYCISTFYSNNNIFQISMFLWIELWTNPKHIPIKSMTLRCPVSFPGYLLIVCWYLQWIIMSKENFEPSPHFTAVQGLCHPTTTSCDEKNWYWKMYKHTCILNILHYNLITYFSNLIFTLRFIIILNFKM
jgi:hypothetical protein